MKKKIIFGLLVACIVFQSLNFGNMAIFANVEATTRQQELYVLSETKYERATNVRKGSTHDCQNLGVWIPKGTEFRIRQTNVSFNKELTLRLRNNDVRKENSITIPKNGDWVSIKAIDDAVPFVSSIVAKPDNLPKVEFELANTYELPIYVKGGDEKAFFEKWDTLKSPYAVYECDSTIFLIPEGDKTKNKFGTLDDLLNYYDNMIAQYDRFAGISENADEVWNEKSNARYFAKANAGGVGAAYYGGTDTAVNSSSIAEYLNYGWMSTHEFGHGYAPLGAISTGEVWNNLLGYYYQKTFRGKSTWLLLEESNRKTYEENRAKSQYEGSDYATKLYFWVNMLDRLGAEKTTAHLYTKLRKEYYNGTGDGLVQSVDDYVNAFSESSGYNVAPYFEFWGLPVSRKAKTELLEEKIYENVFPLRNLTKTDEEADAIKNKLGLSSRYSLVTTSELSKNTALEGYLHIAFDDKSFESVKGKTIQISDGVNVVKRMTVTQKEMSVALPIGVYGVLVEKGDKDLYDFDNQVGYAIVTATNTSSSPSDYTIRANIDKWKVIADTSIIFNGLGGSRYFQADLLIGKGMIVAKTEDKQPHNYFNGHYSTFQVIDKTTGNIKYEKVHQGNVAAKEVTQIPISVGDKIKLIHEENSRLSVFSTYVNKVNINPNARVSEYEITEKGLRRITPNGMNQVDVDAKYKDIVFGYMDQLIAGNPKADFKNAQKLIYEKSMVESSLEKLSPTDFALFKEQYKAYYPFENIDFGWTIDPIKNVSYTGMAITPNVVVKDSNGKTLVENSDYNLVWMNNVDVGTAKVIVKGLGSFDTYQLFQTFSVSPKTNGVFQISKLDNSMKYTGSDQFARFEVRDGSTLLKDGIDYSIVYENNINAGIAKATIVGKGNYKYYPSVVETFEIVPTDVTLGVTLDYTVFDFTGKEIKPIAVVKNGYRTLESGKDFEITYMDNVAVGEGKVVITPKGNYANVSIMTLGFNIVDAMVPTASGTNDFANWTIKKEGIGGGLYATLKIDIEKGTLTVKTENKQPHGYFSNVYSKVSVSDSRGSRSYEKEYIGIQKYSASEETTNIGLGYRIRVFHEEPFRVNVSAQQDSNTNITVSAKITEFEVTKYGLREVFPKEESMEAIEARYYAVLKTYMHQLINTNQPKDFEFATALVAEKQKVEQSVALLSEAQKAIFKDEFKDVYPFNEGHHFGAWVDTPTHQERSCERCHEKETMPLATVDKVVITADQEEVKTTETLTLKAVVQGLYHPKQDVEWTLKDASQYERDTLISADGELYVSANEQVSEIIVVATSKVDRSKKDEYTIRVLTPVLITTLGFADGLKGTAYSQTLQAEGTHLKDWKIVNGHLPEGLSLNKTTGEIAGIPVKREFSTFTIRAENNGYHNERTFSINVESLDFIVDYITTSDGQITHSENVFDGEHPLLNVVAKPTDKEVFKYWISSDPLHPKTYTSEELNALLITKDTTFTAIFEKKIENCKVTYVSDVNGTQTKEEVVSKGSKPIANVKPVLDDNNSFKYWISNDPLHPGTYTSEQLKMLTITRDTIFTAVFEKVNPMWKVDYVSSMDGSVIQSEMVKDLESPKMDVSVKANEGYLFKGWRSSDPNHSKIYTSEQLKTLNIKMNTIFIATFEKKGNPYLLSATGFMISYEDIKKLQVDQVKELANIKLINAENIPLYISVNQKQWEALKAVAISGGQYPLTLSVEYEEGQNKYRDTIEVIVKVHAKSEEIIANETVNVRNEQALKENQKNAQASSEEVIFDRIIETREKKQDDKKIKNANTQERNVVKKQDAFHWNWLWVVVATMGIFIFLVLRKKKKEEDK